MTTITKRPFGISKDGQNIEEYKLTNSRGNFVTIINYGSAITSITLNTASGPVDVALGYKTLEEYENNGGYLGACIGRVANRLGNARFTLNGTEYCLAANDGKNHLHGGLKGFDKHFFNLFPDPDDSSRLHATRLSKDGEENYPGDLIVCVDYTWDDDNRLGISYYCKSSKDTVVNLTNHSYFNLSGENDGSILDNELQLNAWRFTENDGQCLPTGAILPVARTPFDFRKPKAIGRDIEMEDGQLKAGHGYDHNFIPTGRGLRMIARAYSPKTGIGMNVHSNMPGVQFYSGNALTGQIGKSGTTYGPRSGFCLETQYYPNACACQSFPSIILKKNRTYKKQTIYEFDLNKGWT